MLCLSKRKGESKMSNLNELIIKNESELNTVEKDFLINHQQIMSAGVLIQNGFLNLAKSLKNIKDNKLYIAINCESFEDYTERVVGIKKSQAYKYIQVLESLGEEFSTRVEKVGITKLALISSLTSEEQKEIIETQNLEETSVSDLKEQIQKLKQEKEDKEKELIRIKKDNDIETNKLKIKLDKLRNDLKTEKEKPAEKIVETIQDPDLVSKVENLEHSINLKQRVINQLQNKLSENVIANSEELTKFKFYFENIQFEIKQMKMLIDRIPEEKQEGCKKALKAIGEWLC